MISFTPTIEAQAHVRAAISRLGPLAAFHELMAENDTLSRSQELGNGRLISSLRTLVHTELVRDWIEEQQRRFGYDRPFALVALGGTGRGEMAPFSDTDFAFLFADALEGNSFLLELQRQQLHSSEFERRCGFACQTLPFSLDDVPRLSGKQLNSFLDMQPVHDPAGLSGACRERIRTTYDSFAHFLHVRMFWLEQWAGAVNGSELLEGFDIKNEGLRVFLAGIWTIAGRELLHAHEVYQGLDPRDLAAYDFLLRMRAYVHSRRKGDPSASAVGNHAEDILTFADFTSFGELLGPGADERTRFDFATDVRTRLLSARRRVAHFAKGVIERELKVGRAVSPRSPLVFALGGLCHTGSTQCQSPREKSRAALSLLLAAQHYEVPIDAAELQTTFRDAGTWLEPVPELSALFFETRGSLADSFAFLAQCDGAVGRLFPGYGHFEASLDSRVMAERKTLRGTFERQKLRMLERYLREGQAVLARTQAPDGVSVEIESALLDADHLAAVKLALKTKRLPLTDDDIAVRGDESRPLHERFSTGFSGIPLAEYYAPYAALADFPREVLRIVEFLVANRRAFKERAAAGLNDARQVADFARLCQDEQTLRSLFVFTSADRAEWESPETEPARWFNSRELYLKALPYFRPAPDHAEALRAAGYSPEQLDVLKDFGGDFFGGVYRQYANRFGAHLVRLIEDPGIANARAAVVRDGTAVIVGVAARDYRGLAATIGGAFWHQRINLCQAHLFSARQRGLVLDFFHLAPGTRPPGGDLTRFVEDAIKERRYIAPTDEATLPQVAGNATLREWRPGQFCLHFETSEEGSGQIYALTYKVYRHLRGNIFGLTAHAARGKTYVSIYHMLPADLSPLEAQEILARQFWRRSGGEE